MSLEHILLGMLRAPAAGYDLKREFQEGPRHFWSAELSQIYPALQSMQRRGWLSSRRSPSPRGPARRIYARTKKGEAALREWLRAEPAMGTERFAYIGQLIFQGELRDLRHTLRFLQRLRANWTALADRLGGDESRGAPRQRSQARELDDHAFHEQLCLLIGVAALRARIAACDACIDLVRRRLAGRWRGKGAARARS